MSTLLLVARVAAVANVALLLVLASIWGRNYRRHRAQHTLGLLIFAGFLLFQNLLWIYVYGFDATFVDWFELSTRSVRLSMTGLCGLQTIALIALSYITWQ